MNQHYTPGDALQAELEALGEQFEAEEREDHRAQAQRRRQGLPESERDISAYEGLADGGAAPRATDWTRGMSVSSIRLDA